MARTVVVEREFLHPAADVVTRPISMVRRPTLRNARKGKERAPSQGVIERILPGYFVKLATPDGVKFWARVDHVEDGVFHGTVANKMPLDLQEPLAYGERIVFRGHSIFSIRLPSRALDS